MREQQYKYERVRSVTIVIVWRTNKEISNELILKIKQWLIRGITKQGSREECLRLCINEYECMAMTYKVRLLVDIEISTMLKYIFLTQI